MILTYADSNEAQSYDKDFLGGKAKGLFQMVDMGLNVPRFMTLSCHYSLDPPSLTGDSYFRTVFESKFRMVFAPYDIISVRSGAPISMPGMMDTLLNVGIDEENFQILLADYGPIAWDIRARGLRQYSVFEGMDDAEFAAVERYVNIFYGHVDDEKTYKHLYYQYLNVRGKDMPSRQDQIRQAVRWVWESYNSDRAIAYREMNDIPHDIGTAVVLQKMVFGNINDRSGTGVAFSHDPNTGEKGIMGDFLSCGQGEEVVSGMVNTVSIPSIAKDPKWYPAIKILRKSVLQILKSTDYDMLDMEFTIENGVLYFLQIREAKCANKAKVRMLIDSVSDSLNNSEDATNKIMDLVSSMAAKMVDNTASGELEYGTSPIGSALGAVDGKVVGRVATTHDQANRYHEEGTPFIFVAELTSPNDLVPMSQAVGILTRKGGMLSHAALIAREWGKTAVVAFDDMEITGPDTIKVDGVNYDAITLDVSNQKGKVMA